MRFAHPWVLWLLLLLPVLGLLAWSHLRRGARALAAALSPVMAERLTGHLRPGRRGVGLVLMLMAAFFLVLGAARPQRGTQYVAATRRGIDLIIALDVSESMLAEDLKPNRLVRARHEIGAILDRLKGDRVGLVAFAGAAFVQCPLTLDYSAARMFLDFMGPDLIPEPGTNLGEALRIATRAFQSEEAGFRALILISDGEDHMGGLEDAIAEARKAGVRTFSVGIGSESGEPIPIRDAQGQVSGYKKDSAGKVVMTRLNEDPLRQIAEASGGLYVPAAGSLGLDRVLAEIDAMEKKELKGGIHMLYEERYSYFVWPAIVLLLIQWWIPLRQRARLPLGATLALVRKGVRGAGLILGLLATLTLAPSASGPGGMPAGTGLPPVEPGDVPAEERLAALLEEHQVLRARHPGDPRPLYNLGTLLHMKNDLEQAQEYLGVAANWADGRLGSRVAHNLGDTLYKLGRVAEARDAFARAVALDPDNEDAKINLEVTQRLLDALQQHPDSTAQENQQNQQDQQDGQDQEGRQEQQQQGEQEQQQGEQEQQQQQEQGSDQQGEQDQQEQRGEQDQQQREQSEQQEGQHAQPNEAAADRPDSTVSAEQMHALQILRGLEASERDLLNRRFQARSRNVRVEKDW